MDNEANTDSNVNVKKSGCKNETTKKSDITNTDITLEEVCQKMSKLADEEGSGSASSTDSEDLVNAINYNTITSLAALKDIIQGDNDDTPETDSFFQHYFMNHCNNLSSRNTGTLNPPFPFPERRRLSQCREEDEEDERKEVDPSPSTVTLEACAEVDANNSSRALSKDDNSNDITDEQNESGDDEPDESKTAVDSETVEGQEAAKRTVMGARHKFLVTTTEPPPPKSPIVTPAAPVEKALRSQPHNAHTVHFGTKGAEEQRPSVRSIFQAQNLHRDKNYFDSSLIEIRSKVDDGDSGSAVSEDIWVKRSDEKNLPTKAAGSAAAQETVKEESVAISKDAGQERARSGTWGSQTHAKEIEAAKKTTPRSKPKQVRQSSDTDRRQKREQRLDAAITRSTQSVGERKRRGSSDEGQPHPMYQQTIHGTTVVSKRPALFDIFKSRPRGDVKKPPSILKQVKAAVQSMTKSNTMGRDSSKTEPAKVETKEAGAGGSGAAAPKTRDGSAHPHPGSDTRYYHTVTASTSRRPSAMAKVMEIFRGRASVPGQGIPLEDAERRRARTQQQYGAGANLRRTASQDAEKRRSSLGHVPTIRHRASDAFLDPHHAAMLFRDSRGVSRVSLKTKIQGVGSRTG
ncbi:uncharacterized protein LOC106130566 isoform X1 [Amyelois transitella]|uniref:uncharacterized protein LOC106130566 isoform X1 n=1 Tax=Amyelois transitella TaxID=680683 RepID=UPI00298F6CF9|nr:uncharacterized protein LOC106130566 isoform X1 [Amyelois transitella]XP_060809694.1 uncharacterized protein LOC106130566 isoform X1 [Amyelois transitella]